MNTTKTFLLTGLAVVTGLVGMTFALDAKTPVAQGQNNRPACMMQGTNGQTPCMKGNKGPMIDFTGLQTAIKNKDFTAFQKVTSGTQLAKTINTTDKFAKFVQLQGLKAQMQTIKSELGLTGNRRGMEDGPMMGRGGKGGHPMMGSGTRPMMGHPEAVQKALDANDYTAFQTAIKGTPLATQINTQAKFATFFQMHQAMQKGDVETANKLAKELGLPEKQAGKVQGKGMGQGRGNRK